MLYLINFLDLSLSVVYFDQLFMYWVIVYSDQLLVLDIHCYILSR